MITEMLMTMFVELIMLLFYLMPNFPSLDFNINNMINAFYLKIELGIGLFKYIIGSNIYNFTLLLFIKYIQFVILWTILMWIIRKLPIGAD